MLTYNDLSQEQKNVVESDGNVVVLACPGSGKSTTISFKISKELSAVNDYQGVIAISYTNKASKELEEKVQKLSSNVKNSFFGTIDKFCLMEIIVPGTIKNNIELKVLLDEMIEIDGLTKEQIKNLSYEELLEYQKQQICDGKVFLRLIAFFADYILKNNDIVIQYIICKYRAIFIDEFQDCDEYQYSIFNYLVKKGLKGVAVGDPAQSIFEYAHKSSKYLTSLASNTEFNVFTLNKNRRCHQSIIDYSTRFISTKYSTTPQVDLRVGRILLPGKEIDIAKYIDSKIDSIKNKYSIDNLSEIAILTRCNRTGQIIKNSLKTSCILFDETELEKLAKSSIDAQACIEIIKYCYDSDSAQIAEDIVETFCSRNLSKKKKEQLINEIQSLKDNVSYEFFINVVSSILGRPVLMKVADELNNSLNDEDILSNILTINDNKVSIMSIHKSKGLEFDFV